MVRCVIVSVNDKYIPILSVLLMSIINNTDMEHQYCLVVLYKNLSLKNQALLKTLLSKRNFVIQFINVSQYIGNYSFYVGGKNNQSYITNETYFRLLAPQLLPEYKKALYLDCDVVVQKGWDEIFDINLDGMMIAGVRDIWGNWECYKRSSDLVKYRNNTLMLDNPLDYFNAGVLLINLERFRNTFSEKELLNIAVAQQWRKHDQDVLNMVCKGRVKFLEYKWNLIECPSKNALKLTPLKEQVKYEKSISNSLIIHYASRKPWLIKGVLNEEKFWCNALCSPFSKRLLEDFMEEQFISGCCLEENVFRGIKERKMGVRFIIKCVLAWLQVWPLR